MANSLGEYYAPLPQSHAGIALTRSDVSRRCWGYDRACTYERAVNKRGRKKCHGDAASAPRTQRHQEPSQLLQNAENPHAAGISVLASSTSLPGVQQQAHAVEGAGDRQTPAAPIISDTPFSNQYSSPTTPSVSGTAISTSDTASATNPHESGSKHSSGWARSNSYKAAIPLQQQQSSCNEPQAVSATLGTALSSSEPADGSLNTGYPCLAKMFPLLEGTISHSTASELLDFYFTHPTTSLLTSPSPFVLDPVIEHSSVLLGCQTRDVSPALLATILWVCAQTASHPTLLLPRERKRICKNLGDISKALRCPQDFQCCMASSDDRAFTADVTSRYAVQHPEPVPWGSGAVQSRQQQTDRLLNLILITIVVSAGDTKKETLPLYQHAVSLAKVMGFNRLDAGIQDTPFGMPQEVGSHDWNAYVGGDTASPLFESKEEQRRCFWLLYAMDRHWALSYNTMPLLMDQECQVYPPLSRRERSGLREAPPRYPLNREIGPQTTISGTGFFQFFVPLMVILGDIILIHHQQHHPRLYQLVDRRSIAAIGLRLTKLLADIDSLQQRNCCESHNGCPTACEESHVVAVKLYASFIVHVLYVLLHGRWDPTDMLSLNASHDVTPDDVDPLDSPARSAVSDWITSSHFEACASNAISASDIISRVLGVDPELAFMPYLLGINLLQGSFVLLLFAHRMPHVADKPNESVERACESVIRAYEVSVATLSVEFQRGFRMVFRAALDKARNSEAISEGEGRVSPRTGVGSNHLQHCEHTEPQQNQDQLFCANAKTGARSTRNNSTGPHSPANPTQFMSELLRLYRWADGFHGLAV